MTQLSFLETQLETVSKECNLEGEFWQLTLEQPDKKAKLRMMQHKAFPRRSSYSGNRHRRTETLVILWNLMEGCHAILQEVLVLSSCFQQQQVVEQAKHLLKEVAQLALSQ